MRRVMLIAIFVVVSWMAFSSHFKYTPVKITYYERPPNTKRLIVSWTKFWRAPMFEDLHCLEEVGTDCDCMDRSEYESSNRVADAIIFHDADIAAYDLPTSRHYHQNFVYFNLESPKFSRINDLDMPGDYFNTTMSYRRDADYYYTAYGFIPTQKQSTYDEIISSLYRRTKSTFAMISNCNPYSNRDQVISELARYHNITYFGKCSPDGVKCDSDCMKTNLETHRFFLAFENSLCKEYITEKFFRTIEKRLVPVVLKRQIYDVSFIPPGSFVAVDDFKTIKELAEYLNEAQRNDSLYMSHFDWIKTWRNEPKPPSAIRQLCDDLNKDIEHQVDVRQFLSYECLE